MENKYGVGIYWSGIGSRNIWLIFNVSIAANLISSSQNIFQNGQTRLETKKKTETKNILMEFSPDKIWMQHKISREKMFYLLKTGLAQKTGSMSVKLVRRIQMSKTTVRANLLLYQRNHSKLGESQNMLTIERAITKMTNKHRGLYCVCDELFLWELINVLGNKKFC